VNPPHPPVISPILVSATAWTFSANLIGFLVLSPLSTSGRVDRSNFVFPLLRYSWQKSLESCFFFFFRFHRKTEEPLAKCLKSSFFVLPFSEFPLPGLCEIPLIRRSEIFFLPLPFSPFSFLRPMSWPTTRCQIPILALPTITFGLQNTLPHALGWFSLFLCLSSEDEIVTPLPLLPSTCERLFPPVSPCFRPDHWVCLRAASVFFFFLVFSVISLLSYVLFFRSCLSPFLIFFPFLSCGPESCSFRRERVQSPFSLWFFWDARQQICIFRSLFRFPPLLSFYSPWGHFASGTQLVSRPRAFPPFLFPVIGIGCRKRLSLRVVALFLNPNPLSLNVVETAPLFFCYFSRGLLALLQRDAAPRLPPLFPLCQEFEALSPVISFFFSPPLSVDPYAYTSFTDPSKPLRPHSDQPRAFGLPFFWSGFFSSFRSRFRLCRSW